METWDLVISSAASRVSGGRTCRREAVERQIRLCNRRDAAAAAAIRLMGHGASGWLLGEDVI